MSFGIRRAGRGGGSVVNQRSGIDDPLERLWWRAAHVLTAAGWAAALPSWGVATTLVTALAAALVCTAAAVAFTESDDVDLGRALHNGLWSGFAGVAALALMGLFQWAGVVAVAGMALTAPAIWTRLLPRARRERAAERREGPANRWFPEPGQDASPQRGYAQADPPEVDVAALDDDALCRAWRRSFACLRAARSAADRANLAAERQKYLDELSARHPAEISQWLASRPLANGDPRSFLGRSGPGPTG